MSSPRPASPYADEQLTELGEDELVEERHFLLTSLRDLDAELAAGDLDQHDYLALKDGYTARAAAVLRALDARRGGARERAEQARPGEAADVTAQPAPAPMDRGPRRRDDQPARSAPRMGRRRARVLAFTLVVALFAVAAGLLVARNSGERLPGQTVSGAVPPGEGNALREAAADLNNGKYLDAVKLYDQVIREDPTNAEALAYRGWILRLTGVAGNDPSLVQEGLQSVRAAESADPSYPDAHFFVGEILLRDRHDPAGAAAEFREFLAHNPPQAMVPEVQGELGQAQAEMASTTVSPTTAPGR